VDTSIFKSRKFWIMVVDVVVSIVTYFVGKYAAPAIADDIFKMIVTLQPVILLVIGSITAQNLAGIKATASLKEAKLYTATETPEQAQG
jgi:hypothetical protein